MKTLQTILIKLIGYVVLVIWGMICGIMLPIGFTTVKLSEVRIFKLLALIVFISLAACEKEPEIYCYDCTFKQDNGTEYKGTYKCTEAELQAVISGAKGMEIKCVKR